MAVSSLLPNDAADACGELIVGDILVEINGKGILGFTAAAVTEELQRFYVCSSESMVHIVALRQPLKITGAPAAVTTDSKEYLSE